MLMLQMKKSFNYIYANYLKRCLDLTFSLLLFILLFPLVFFFSLAILIETKKNPLFFQERPGKNQIIFKIIKIKTMNDNRDEKGNLLPDNERLTHFGKFVRKMSIDEIPQLINVIKGDMSIIGPRPLRSHYLAYYTEREQTRHSIRPGITGLAQINGRNFLDWDSKLELDAKYVEQLSLSLDFKIFFKTIIKTINSSDVSVATNLVLEDFDVHRKNQLLNNAIE